MRTCECGCEPVMDYEEIGPIAAWAVRCLGCGTTTGLCYTPDEAMECWERGYVAGPGKRIEEMGNG